MSNEQEIREAALCLPTLAFLTAKPAAERRMRATYRRHNVLTPTTAASAPCHRRHPTSGSGSIAGMKKFVLDTRAYEHLVNQNLQTSRQGRL